MRAAVLLVLVSLAACSTRSEEAEDPRGFSISDQIGDWSATIEPRNNSGIRGTVSVTSALAGSLVRITINGAMANNHHPWHVHSGTCETNGPIVGSADAYTPLHIGSDGTANASVTIGTALNDDAKYHVNVHRSTSEMNVIVACGNLNN